MKDTDKIIALAKLDGWNLRYVEPYYEFFDAHRKEWFRIYRNHNYLTSYDAIIPLVKKQDEKTRRRLRDDLLKSMTGEVLNIFGATPTEIADALLKVKGLM